MSREREELLARVRGAEDPTQADEERVLQALQRALGAGRAASVEPEVVERAQSMLAAPRASAAFKLAAAAALLLVVAASTLALRAPRPRPGPATPAEHARAPERSALELRSTIDDERQARPAPRVSPDAATRGSGERTADRLPSHASELAAPASPSAEQAPTREPRLPSASTAPAPPSAERAPTREPRLPSVSRRTGRGEGAAPVPGAPRPPASSTLVGARPAGSAAVGARAPSVERPAAPTPRTPPRNGPSAESALRPEIALLERVQSALRRGDGAAALRELDAHSTTDRVLLAERQAARILALCLVGRTAEARSAARAFAAQHPDSPQRAAIDGSCANSRRIEQP